MKAAPSLGRGVPVQAMQRSPRPAQPVTSGAIACAHRGLSEEFPENTIPAFQAAAKAGFRIVEMDLRVTLDNEVVVLHDAGIERTTQGNGRVADMTYEELRANPTTAGPVPRLDDLFSAMKQWSGLWNLEVKAPGATAPMLDLVRHHGLEARTQVSSMDTRPLEVARQQAPNVARGLIIPGPVEKEDLEAAAAVACRWLNVDHDYLDQASLDHLRGAGYRVAAWTVNEPERARALSEMGVACVITDTQAVLKELGAGGAASSF